MAKQYCFLKLIPPRPTFARDMTHEERLLTEEHGRYLQETSRLAEFFSSAQQWRMMALLVSPYSKWMMRLRLDGWAKAILQ